MRARLLNLARQRGEDFQITLRNYLFERFLYRLGRSPVRERFVLKGAMLLRLWADQPYRATLDLDLLAHGSSDFGDLWRIITPSELEDFLTLADDEFALVDQAVAFLKGSPLHELVQIEYRRSYGSDERNCRRVGLSRGAYRQEKLAALWTLYTLLRPRIDGWRQR